MTETEQKKAFLRSYRTARAKEARLLEQRRLLEAGIKSPRFDGMPRGSGAGEGLATYAARVDEIQREIGEMQNTALQQYVLVLRQLQKMAEETEYNVLVYRYLNGFDWYEIGERVGYSRRQVLRIHGAALQHFELPKDGTQCHTDLC